MNAADLNRRKPHLIDARRRIDCLRLGERSSLICIGLWLVSGIVYPTALHLGVGNVRPIVYGLFVGSLTICGLIVSTYPFFFVTYSCVRRLYPTFVQAGVCDETDLRELQRLQMRLPLYFGGTLLVPLLAIVGLLLAAEFYPTQKLTMYMVAFGGFAAFAGTYWLFRRLSANLAALARVIDSSRDPTA